MLTHSSLLTDFTESHVSLSSLQWLKNNWPILSEKVSVIGDNSQSFILLNLMKTDSGTKVWCMFRIRPKMLHQHSTSDCSSRGEYQQMRIHRTCAFQAHFRLGGWSSLYWDRVSKTSGKSEIVLLLLNDQLGGRHHTPVIVSSGSKILRLLRDYF